MRLSLSVRIVLVVYVSHHTRSLVVRPQVAPGRCGLYRPRCLKAKPSNHCFSVRHHAPWSNVYHMSCGHDIHVKSTSGDSSSRDLDEDIADLEGLNDFLDTLSVGSDNDRGNPVAAAPMVDTSKKSVSASQEECDDLQHSHVDSPSVSSEALRVSSKETLKVDDDDDNAPIDWVLSRRLPLNSRRFYRKAIEQGRVKVNGRIVKGLVRVKRGFTISIEKSPDTGNRELLSDFSPTVLSPQHLPEMAVVYEDKHLFAVWKPAGMICQPCEAAKSGTVLHGLLHHMVQRGQVKTGDMAAAKTLSQGIVHRLDKHTSGMMIIAKTLAASSKLSALFKRGMVKKEYLAICHGDPGFDRLVDAPLYRRSSGKIGAVSKSQAKAHGARDAETRVRNVATVGGMSLCRAEIKTGRMHQVRAHLKHINCPLVGDKEYGDIEANARLARRGAHRVVTDRPLLHSMSLEFEHPFTKKRMIFKSPMPDDMWKVALDILRSSGTREQKKEFRELQAIRETWGGARVYEAGGGDGKGRRRTDGDKVAGKKRSASSHAAEEALKGVVLFVDPDGSQG